MRQILLSWVGKGDIEAAKFGDVHRGAISEAAASGQFRAVWALDNWADVQESCCRWIQDATGVLVTHLRIPLRDTSSLAEIYEAVVSVVERLQNDGVVMSELAFHLGPGTSTMSATWLLVAAKFQVRMIRSTTEDGVIDVPLPFEVETEYRVSRNLHRLSRGEEPDAATFGRILYRCSAMAQAVAEAKAAALVDFNVLLQGPSGSGKELFAEAIHNASSRAGKAFIAVNCGAIPAELLESELFGHDRGAFTGALESRLGKFEAANGGTIFLDEIAEMTLAAQVRLLRVIDQQQITRVGTSKVVNIDVRVIAATHKDVVQEVDRGSFREDLMYRLLVLPVRIPALRERGGDIDLLIDTFLEDFNSTVAAAQKLQPLSLSLGARKALNNHNWPGNVRELKNTLFAIAIASLGKETIDRRMVESRIIRRHREERILNRSLGNGFDIRAVMAEVASHYVKRALNEGSNKTASAHLLGLASYQVLDKWLNRYVQPKQQPVRPNEK